MSLNFPLGEFAEVDERNVSDFDAGSGKNEIVTGAREGYHIIYLIFFKLEGFDDVFDFELEEVNEEDFVVEGNNNLIDPNFNLFYF